MGVALFAPPTEDVRRRAVAVALSLAANGALLLLLIVLPQRVYTPDAPDVLTVTFVTLPPAPQPTPPADAPVPAETEVDEPPPSDETEPELVEIPSDAPADVADDTASAPQEQEDEPRGGGAPQRPTEIIGAARPLPEGSGPGSTGFAVREIFCLSTSDANRDALHCPPSDGSEGLPMLQFASPENIARAQAAFAGLSDTQIRALFADRGLPVRDLAGQPTLADPSARPTASADQMRDTLPPLHPDPAFGD